MKIKNIIKPQLFFEMLGKCKGKVELVTTEGDRLNLKSTLCQYILLTQMFSDEKMGEFDIFLSEPEDILLLDEFLIRK